MTTRDDFAEFDRAVAALKAAIARQRWALTRFLVAIWMVFAVVGLLVWLLGR